jgi:hypothetical protein
VFNQLAEDFISRTPMYQKLFHQRCAANTHIARPLIDVISGLLIGCDQIEDSLFDLQQVLLYLIDAVHI